jgi:carboxypeptidase Taq
MRADLDDMDGLLRDGDLGPIKTWLDANIHGPGRALTPNELCAKITGEPMSARFFVEYLNTKYADVYQL